MPPVTIRVANGKILVVDPNTAVTSTNPAIGLDVTWRIVGDDSITFANPPIQWAVNPPPPYTPFSTSVSGSGANWGATMPSMSPNTTQRYKYNIVYTSPSGSLDPDIENQGVPPGAPTPSGLGKPEGTPGVGRGGDNPSGRN